VKPLVPYMSIFMVDMLYGYGCKGNTFGEKHEKFRWKILLFFLIISKSSTFVL
jgi:hypothetical protein